MSSTALLRKLWERILEIQERRSRRSKLLDARYGSKNIVIPNDPEGLRLWIRRRGRGVDILGLDDPSAYEKLKMRMHPLRHKLVYFIPRLQKADLDTILWMLETEAKPKDYSWLFQREYEEMKEYLDKISELKKLIEEKTSTEGWVWISKYVPERSTFNKIVSTLRQIAVYDPYTRKWKISLSKMERLVNNNLHDDVRRELEKYSEYLSFEILHGGKRESVDAKSFINEFRDLVKAKIEFIKPWEKNQIYYFIPWRIADRIPEYEKIATYYVEKYDPDLHRRVEVPYRVYKRIYEGILFPRGIMNRLEKEIREKKLKVYPDPFAPWLLRGYLVKSPVKLRDYQAEAVASILDYLIKYGGATLQAATGSGKTEVAVDIVKRVLETVPDKNRKIFFLSLSTDLLRQFKARAKKYGIPVGLVTADEFDIDKPVIAVTIQSLARAIEKVTGEKLGKVEKPDEEVKLEEYDVRDKKKLVELFRNSALVIIDECQHVPARTVKYCVKNAPRALKLGLSATPWRDDQRDMEIYSWVGDVVPRKITSSELIEKGYLVPAYILVVRYNHPSYRDVDREIMKIRGSGSGSRRFRAVEQAVYYNDDRNKWIVNMARMLKELGFVPGLILVRQREHGRILNRLLKGQGLRSEYVAGDISPKKREQIFDMVRNNKLDFIVATSLADEGLDLPPLKVLILTAGGKSKVKTLQRIGRVIRPWPGKKIGLVIDIVDDITYFRDHIDQRKKMYRTEPKWVIEEISYQYLPEKLVKIKEFVG